MYSSANQQHKFGTQAGLRWPVACLAWPELVYIHPSCLVRLFDGILETPKSEKENI
jgi:hypothetical protein